MTPRELRLNDGGRMLEIEWDDAGPSRVSAERLRAACRCAACTRARADNTIAPIVDRVSIAAIDPVGSYAVNLQFSDGHARGIFPWSFLREIAAETADAISCSTGADRPTSVPGDPRRKEDA
jgi:DUF971 family protein